MKNLTWQNPEQLFVAQELINKVKSKCCGIKVNIVCSHFKNKNGDNFGNLNRQKHTDRTPNILNVIEIIINYSIEECTKKMQEIIVNHKDLLENIDFSVKPEHPSNYGKVRKSVK